MSQKDIKRVRTRPPEKKGHQPDERRNAVPPRTANAAIRWRGAAPGRLGFATRQRDTAPASIHPGA